MAFVQQRLQQQGMQVDSAPGDDEVRETYNFAPGYNGIVYCADSHNKSHDTLREEEGADNATTEKATQENPQEDHDDDNGKKTGYKLKSMRWGLIPFWTKRNPDYGSLMRTINCRDDSLI